MGLSFALAGAAVIAYLLVVRRRFSTLGDAAVAAFLLAVAQIVVTQRVLALLGLLRLLPLLLVNLLLLAGLLLLAAARRQLGEALQTTLGRLAGFLRLLARAPLALALAVVLVVLMVGTLWQVALLPEDSYDGLAYHLPITFSRLQYGDMRFMPGWPDWISSYPEHSEFLMGWIALLDGSPALVDGVQWAFWPAALVALYALARKLGIAPVPAFLGSMVLGFAPVTILQARVAYNDLVIAALLLIALDLLVERAILPTALAGIALGLVAGIKYAGVVFPIVGGLALLLTDPPWRSGQTFWRRVVALGLPALLLGVPWYMANWVRFGNPIWPFIVWGGGQQLFHGITSVRAIYLYALSPQYQEIPGPLLAPFFWLEPAASYHYEARYSGLGVLWPALGIPALLYLLSSFRQVRRPALVVALVGLGGTFLATSYNWIPRYVFFILGLGALGVGWVLHAGTRWTRRLARVLLLCGVVYSLWTAGPQGLAAPARLDALSRLPAGLRPSLGMADTPAYRWLEENTYDGAQIVYGLGLYFIAPLWGNDRDNQVLFERQRIPEFWHPLVEQMGANYVFVETHPYNDWIGSAAGWVPIYTDDQFTIYRLRPMELSR